MNKSGKLLASETLKMVLAVISIGFLVYLLAAIYFASSDAEKRIQAESTIERIKEIISRLEFQIDVSSENITDIVPAKWNVFSYTGAEKKPNSCVDENCICICDEVLVEDVFGFFQDRQIKECAEDGVCLIVSNLKELENIEIGAPNVDPTTLLITEKDGLIGVSEI